MFKIERAHFSINMFDFQFNKGLQWKFPKTFGNLGKWNKWSNLKIFPNYFFSNFSTFSAALFAFFPKLIKKSLIEMNFD